MTPITSIGFEALRFESNVDVDVSSRVPFAIYWISPSKSKFVIEGEKLGAKIDSIISKVKEIDNLDLFLSLESKLTIETSFLVRVLTGIMDFDSLLIT